MHRTDAPASHSKTGTHVQLEYPVINREGIQIPHNFQIITTGVFIVQEITRLQIVQHSNGRPQPLTFLLVVQAPQYTKTHLTHHIHLLIPARTHQPVVHTVNLPYMCKHQPLTLTLHNFNLTYTKLLPHHLHKITKAIITQTNNKCAHHQHNPLMHSFHNLSTLMFHHRILHNIHLLTVHLHIAPIP